MQVRSAVLPVGMTIPSPAPPPFDPAFLARLRAGDQQAFEAMAEAYYERLVRYAYGYVRDLAAAEDVVQDTLFNIWLAHEQLIVRGSLSSYLFGAVRNRALNYTRHERVAARWSKRAISSADDLDAWIGIAATPVRDWEEADEAAAFEARMTAVRQAIA
ncbi:MAG TPA: sigma-70 family RNA polymerase sigma factor, partial [Gemmatimonadaceae bacterium]|nr:sigma-70 family RNA polymerase sigma factor [Gemmatimonadaceae bacterium]